MNLNRRETFKSASIFAAGMALAACGGTNAASVAKKNILLVHGAWHSSVHWNRIATLLADMGHNVSVIDLPGSGLNVTYPSSYLVNDFAALATELSPIANIRLSDYRDAIVAKINKMVANGKVTLVGHSFAGMSITAAAEVVPDKIARIVYLAAYAPSSTYKTVFDMISLPENAAGLTGTVAIANPSAVGAIRINPRNGDAAYVEAIRKCFYSDLTTAECIRFATHCNPDLPLAPASDDGSGTVSKWGSVPRTFIRTTLDNAIPVALQDKLIAAADAMTPLNKFDVKTLATSHSPFASKPDTLAQLLDGLA